MSDMIEFELVSPERLLVSESVEMVVVPGTEGDFGVLGGHAPTVSSVRAGVVAVYENGTVTARFFVAGGFAEVTPERCTVLADDAVPMGEIDRAAVGKTLPDLRDEVAAARDEAEKDAAEKALAIAEAKIVAVDAPVY